MTLSVTLGTCFPICALHCRLVQQERARRGMPRRTPGSKCSPFSGKALSPSTGLCQNELIGSFALDAATCGATACATGFQFFALATCIIARCLVFGIWVVANTVHSFFSALVNAFASTWAAVKLFTVLWRKHALLRVVILALFAIGTSNLYGGEADEVIRFMDKVTYSHARQIRVCLA